MTAKALQTRDCYIKNTFYRVLAMDSRYIKIDTKLGPVWAIKSNFKLG